LLTRSDRTVLDYALLRLRAKIGYTTIAFHLMPKAFSLSDIQQTYETILGRQLDPRNFRRRLVSSGLLQPENRLRREGSHRPAALYSFAGNHDPASYLTPAASPLGQDSPDPGRGDE
jgi:8-oxo-dGTP diphosphatase